jgi:hypothetical protein
MKVIHVKLVGKTLFVDVRFVARRTIYAIK